MGILGWVVLAWAGASAAAGADQVRQAETAFAKAFADRDQAKFFALVADDATFLSPTDTLSGKAKVREVWSGFFGDAKPPFNWRPERVVVNGAGDIGLSTGPVLDPAGKHVGNYSSIWQKQKDGSW
ncbi:MAG: nuclear transport factor 2 family protein, partial [Acidobacteriota bacterium]